MLGRLRESSLPRRLAIALLSVIVVWSYAFYASFGRILQEWVTHSVYSDMLAEGFRSGHLYLTLKPPDVLLAQENPWAPHLRPLWLWDSSLYEGRYYIYWGPLPALLLAAAKVLLRVPPSVVIGDQYLAFAFAVVTFVSLALLVDELGRRVFSAPLWLSACAILVIGLANPMPFTLTRGAVYEVAILSGQAFLAAGMLFAAQALLASERSALRLVAAGTCWACVLACRVSTAPTVALLVLATALAAAPRPWSLRRLFAPLSQLATPVALGGALLLVYNYERFGSLFDFGVQKQLTTTPFKTSSVHVWPNLYSYLLRPYESLCHFPFIQSLSNYGESFPPNFRLPAGHLVEEPVVGVLLIMPWLGFALYAVYALVRGLLALRDPAARAALDQQGVVRLWAGFCALMMGTLGILIALGLFLATMRYLVDVRQGLLLLGALGAFTLYERCRTRTQRYLAITAITVCAAYTIATGIALGFDGYYRQFSARNPELYGSLAEGLSFCPAP
jgi:hypothetical protein